MALLILALLQRIFLMSSLMLLLVWLIFFMVLIKLLPILGTISGKTVKLMVLALICLGLFNNLIQRNQSAAFSSGKVRPNHETNINIIARRTGKDVNSHTVLD